MWILVFLRLIRLFGRIIDEIVKIYMQVMLHLSEYGVYEVLIENMVCGRPVKVFGAIVKGVLKIGTAYIPRGM